MTYAHLKQCFYLFIFVREHTQGRDRERERARAREQGARSVRSPTRGSIPWPWHHDLSRNQELDARKLGHPGAPHAVFYLKPIAF